jgi:hypothetical protein
MMKGASWIAGALILMVGGCGAWEQTNAVTEGIVYRDEGLGLVFRLPESWRGYSVLTQRWQATVHGNEGENIGSEDGPVIVLRNPQWRADDPWQDIPIMIFTRRQWEDEHAGLLSPFAGGVIYELGHNDRNVFGIYSRFNADESVKGAEEAGEIAQRNLDANTARVFPQ